MKKFVFFFAIYAFFLCSGNAQTGSVGTKKLGIESFVTACAKKTGEKNRVIWEVQRGFIYENILGSFKKPRILYSTPFDKTGLVSGVIIDADITHGIILAIGASPYQVDTPNWDSCSLAIRYRENGEVILRTATLFKGNTLVWNEICDSADTKQALEYVYKVIKITKISGFELRNGDCFSKVWPSLHTLKQELPYIISESVSDDPVYTCPQIRFITPGLWGVRLDLFNAEQHHLLKLQERWLERQRKIERWETLIDEREARRMERGLLLPIAIENFI